MQRIVSKTIALCISNSGSSPTHLQNNRSQNDNKVNTDNSQSFFDGKNYRRIIERMNGGHKVAMDYIAFIEKNQKLYLNFAKELTSCSKKSESLINQQPLLSSYDTTKNALIQIIKAPDSQANQIKKDCDAIKKVIDGFKEQINEMYPCHRFSNTREHCKAKEMKKLFKSARSSLQNTLDELADLSKKQKDATKAVSTAEKEREKFNGSSTTSKNKLPQTHEKATQRRQELEIIEHNIASAKASQKDREKRYREEATKILEQCQELEKQYLDQFKQNLTELCKAVASSEYSKNHAAIYQQLISDITTDQNSTKDLNNWAEMNGAITSKMTDENDSNVLPTTESATIHQANDIIICDNQSQNK